MGWLFVVLSAICVVVLVCVIWNMMHMPKYCWPQFILLIIMMVIAIVMGGIRAYFHFTAGGW